MSSVNELNALAEERAAQIRARRRGYSMNLVLNGALLGFNLLTGALARNPWPLLAAAVNGVLLYAFSAMENYFSYRDAMFAQQLRAAYACAERDEMVAAALRSGSAQLHIEGSVEPVIKH